MAWWRSRRALGLGAIVVAAAGLGLGLALWYGRAAALPLAASASGAASGRSLAAPLLVADELWLPARCHAPDDAPRVVAGWRLAAAELHAPGDAAPASPGAAGLVLGVVASARDAEPDTLAAARHVSAAFARGGVQLVVVLGGLPGDEAGERALLEALAPPPDAPWAVVALPGDREHLAAHRAAIDALAARGLPVFDGARLRAIRASGATLALVPGVPAPPDAPAPLLIAGAAGCAYDGDDVARTAAFLANQPPPRLALTVLPPRQTGAGATDLGIEGVHVGDPGLAPLAAAADVAVHGWLDAAAGKRSAAAGPVVVGAAPLDPAALVAPGWSGGAIIVRLPRTWQTAATSAASGVAVELIRLPPARGGP